MQFGQLVGGGLRLGGGRCPIGDVDRHAGGPFSGAPSVETTLNGTTVARAQRQR